MTFAEFEFVDMTHNVAVAVLAVLGLLVVATRIAWPQRKKKQELWLRTRTWWVIVLLIAASIALPSWVPVALFGLISFLAFKGFVTLIPTRRADHRVLFWAYLAIPIQYYWVAVGWYGVFMPLVVLAIPLYDFTSVTNIRLSQGKSPFVGDLQHFSHRLVQRGLSRRAAVIVIHGFTAVTAIAGISLASLKPFRLTRTP